VGSFDLGKAKYDIACATCHSAGTYDPSGPFGNLAGKQDRVVGNLGTISSGMNGITLTTGEVADLKAFLSAVK